MSLWRVAIDQSSGRARSEPESIPTPASDTQHISFSSDGMRLAYVGASYTQNIRKLNFDPTAERIVGSAEVVGSSGEMTSAVLSPDGQMLACHSVCGQPDIFSLKLGGSILNQLTSDITNEMVPAWSPDGRNIAYYSNKSGAYQIWMINRDGSGARQITEASAPGGAVLPVWSPDGSRLAYSLFGDGALIMDLKKPWGKQTPIETALIDNREYTHFVAHSWSPDGKYLAGSGYFARRHIGVFAYSIETRRYESLADFGTLVKWLADSKRCLIVFEDKVFIADLQTRKPREIFSFALDKINGLDVSKDNRSIYVSASSTEADIWLLSLE